MLEPRHATILSTAIKARDSRSQWMTNWQELAEIFLPNRADFTVQHADGQNRQVDLWDTGPQLSARGLMSAIATMLRPPGKRFFKAMPKNQVLNASEAVRTWLYAVTEITYQSLYDPRVNTDKMLSEVDGDLVVFGTGIVHMGWNTKDRHLTLKPKSLATTVLVAGRDGNPNGSFSFTRPTLRQICEEFGEDKLTDKMREAYNTPEPKLDQQFEILHAICPNADWKAMGGKGRFPVASVWISVDCKEVIDEKGFNEFPDICPRWDTSTNEVYARSPAMVALPDARVVHAMAKTFLDAGEMALRPPTWSYAKTVVGDMQLFSGGHTIIDASGFQGSGAPINALQLGIFPEKIFEVYTKKNENVAAAFFRDILELPSSRDGQMTATEINARLDQFLRQAAPVFARLNDNYNAPLVNRAFSILMREGMYPPAPPEMYGQDVEFEYESPIKAARDKAEAMKVVEGLQMLLPMAEAEAKLTGSATLLDNIDFDATARFIGIKADLPQAIFRPIEQMMQMRDDREKQKKQMQMAEMASKVAPAAAQLADSATRAKQGGMLGFDQPLPIPAPGLIGQGQGGTLPELQGIYDEVA